MFNELGWRMYYGRHAVVFNDFPQYKSDDKLEWFTNDNKARWWAWADVARMPWQHKKVYRIFHKPYGRWIVMYNQYQRPTREMLRNGEIYEYPLITNLEEAIKICEFHFKTGEWK